MEHWRDEARCAAPNFDPNMWFSDPSEEDELEDIVLARKKMCLARDICRMCPVRIECLEYAMYRPFLHGMWGGLSGEERKTLRRTRALNDKSLVIGLFPEPDLAAYVGFPDPNSDAIVRTIRARRVCQICGEEKDYSIPKDTGSCRDCAVAQEALQFIDRTATANGASNAT